MRKSYSSWNQPGGGEDALPGILCKPSCVPWFCQPDLSCKCPMASSARPPLLQTVARLAPMHLRHIITFQGHTKHPANFCFRLLESPYLHRWAEAMCPRVATSYPAIIMYPGYILLAENHTWFPPNVEPTKMFETSIPSSFFFSLSFFP
ncbi:hypothetical protein GGI42DRAFT_92122 [Trichoderma sp. SZMC 28013]